MISVCSVPARGYSTAAKPVRIGKGSSRLTAAGAKTATVKTEKLTLER